MLLYMNIVHIWTYIRDTSISVGMRWITSRSMCREIETTSISERVSRVKSFRGTKNHALLKVYRFSLVFKELDLMLVIAHKYSGMKGFDTANAKQSLI